MFGNEVGRAKREKDQKEEGFARFKSVRGCHKVIKKSGENRRSCVQNRTKPVKANRGGTTVQETSGDSFNVSRKPNGV